VAMFSTAFTAATMTNKDKIKYLKRYINLDREIDRKLEEVARLHRQGQKNIVRIYHLLVEDTVDFRVLDVLKGKNIRQEELIASLKAEVRREEGNFETSNAEILGKRSSAAIQTKETGAAYGYQI
jgi:hypothetical protein